MNVNGNNIEAASLYKDVTLEQQVIACAVQHEQAQNFLVDILQVEDFYDPRWANYYKFIVAMTKEGIRVDTITLRNEMKNKDKVYSDEDYVTVVSDYITPTSMEYNCKILKELSTKRKLQLLALQIPQMLKNGKDAFAIVDEVEDKILELAGVLDNRQPALIKEFIHQMFARIEERHADQKKIIGHSSGYKSLDDQIGGFEEGNVTIIAGRPSMGKTTIALNMAYRMAEEVPVAFISIETAREPLLRRVFSFVGKVDHHNIKTGYMRDDEMRRLTHAGQRMYEVPLVLDDSPSLSLVNLSAKIKQVVSKYGVKVIFIDYLQLMDAGKNESREREIAMLSAGIKKIAKRTSTVIFVLSQLNRTVETRKDKRPLLSDLRESGAIEQDADIVIFMYRPEYYGEKTVDGKSTVNYAEAIVAKNRDGGVGIVPLTYIKEQMRFENYIEEGNQLQETLSNLSLF